MRSAQLALTALALVAANAVVAADRNLLPNGDFSQQNQLAGWSCLGGSWSSDDAASNAGSGSMWLQNYNFSDGYCTSACIAVRPGAAYSLGGQSRVLFGNPVITIACAEAYASAQCSSFTFNLQGPTMSTASAWNSAPAIASSILSDSTLSLKCTVTLHNPVAGDMISAHLDNLFFTTDVIFADAFEAP